MGELRGQARATFVARHRASCPSALTVGDFSMRLHVWAEAWSGLSCACRRPRTQRRKPLPPSAGCHVAASHPLAPSNTVVRRQAAASDRGRAARKRRRKAKPGRRNAWARWDGCDQNATACGSRADGPWVAPCFSSAEDNISNTPQVTRCPRQNGWQAIRVIDRRAGARTFCSQGTGFWVRYAGG